MVRWRQRQQAPLLVYSSGNEDQHQSESQWHPERFSQLKETDETVLELKIYCPNDNNNNTADNIGACSLILFSVAFGHISRRSL